jgi:hypothetical protein
MPAQSGDCRLPRVGDNYFKIVKGPLELALQPGVVLDNQQLWLVFGHECSGPGRSGSGFRQ